LNRKKRGFTPPIINWLNNSISDLESQYFSQKRIKEGKLFDYEYIKKISDDYKNGKTSNYVKIWSMICLQSWLEVFTKKYNFTI
jgi:asparagine synthase (glutamine-hydrolysing)